MVSGHLKFTGIPRVDGLLTGPPGFGASQIQSSTDCEKYKTSSPLYVVLDLDTLFEELLNPRE